MASPLESALNVAWVLLGGFLVMFMQAGFAMLETGFTRSRNAAHTMAMNFLVYPVGVLGFWLVGFGLMMGGVEGWASLGPSVAGAREVAVTLGGKTFGLFGWARFALVTAASDPATLAMFLFTTVFLDTAATIPTGAMAERWKLSAFLLYALFMSALLYPLYGNWVWGGGWLASLGANFGLGHGMVDFAGAAVVHMTGGVAGLAGTLVLGPRLGKFRADGTIGATPGHNLPLTVVGTLVLAFGWFGFNAGSTLSMTSARLPLVAVNTMLASAAGAVSALACVWIAVRKPDLGVACNGLLGGLVAITGGCAFMSPAAAVLVGAVAGGLVVWTVQFLERRLRIDDPVGAISVHGSCGAWGGIAVGLLADGGWGAGWNGVAGPVRGLLFGDAGQLAAQLVGIAVNATFVFGAAYGFFQGVERLLGNRVSAEVEQAGLDALELGTDAYPRS